MKFGQLEDISGVDFTLPPLTERTLKVLGGEPAAHFGAYVGLSRWASKDWLGNIYPKGTKQADFLHHYAKSFNGIELNSTHYRIPTVAQVEKWRDMVGPGFRFSPKIPQRISHYRKLLSVQEDLAEFVNAIARFEDHLGCCFVQLHDSFSPKSMAHLADFLPRWPREMPLAVEFRHADWFESRCLLPQVLDLLETHGVGAVITDVAGRRDVSHGSLSSRIAMIRLVGNALHETDYTRSMAWMGRLSEWKQHGLEQVYVFPHEPEDLMASELANFWIQHLNKRFDLRIAASNSRPDPGQLALF